MINRMTKSISIFILIILLTGCAKFETTMTINKDKSMELSIISALDKNIAQNKIDTVDINEYERRGFYIEKYIEDGKKGYKLIRQIKNIDDVSTEGNISKEEMTEGLYGDSEYIFIVKKGFFKTTYKAEYDFDISELLVDENNQLLQPYESKDMDLKFRLNLPYKAISSNATSKSNQGKILEWDLTQVKEISFEFPIYDMTKIYISIGVGILVFLLIIVSLMSKKKKKPKSSPTQIYDGETRGFMNQMEDNEDSVEMGMNSQEESNKFITYEDVVKEQNIIPTPVDEPIIQPSTGIIPQPTVIEESKIIPTPVVEEIKPSVEKHEPEVVIQPTESSTINLDIPKMIETPNDNNNQ